MTGTAPGSQGLLRLRLNLRCRLRDRSVLELSIEGIRCEISPRGPARRAKLIQAHLREQRFIAQRREDRAKEGGFEFDGSGHAIVKLDCEPVSCQRLQPDDALHNYSKGSMSCN